MNDCCPINPSAADGVVINSDVCRPSANNDETPAASATTTQRHGNLSAIAPAQVRCINQNNYRSLIWNVSLTDDQDEVSEHFLSMNNVPTADSEKFGLSILTVPENIRKQADELFKPSEINPNKIFDLINIKVSWILPSSYKQYLKSITPNVADKGEKHVLYPWTGWDRMIASACHRLSPDSVAASSPTASDGRLSLSLSLSSPSSLSLSSLSLSSPLSSSSSRYALHPVAAFNSSMDSGVKNNNNGSDNRSNNGNSSNSSDNISIDSNRDRNSNDSDRDNYLSFAYRGCGTTATSMIAATTTTITLTTKNLVMDAEGLSRPYVNAHFDELNSPRWSVQQHRQTATLSPVPDRGDRELWSVSHADRSPADRSPSGRWPSRLYYCVNADSNTINKLVEHYCTFCYKNHEPPEIYGGHLVRDATRTTCPKLRALRCKHCNGTGDNAHTIKYCPFLYSNYS